MSLDVVRLAAVLSPLRRTLRAAAAAREQLPDIPDAQVEIIRALPAGTTAAPGELAASLGLGRSTISNLLAQMERRGLISRETRSDDRRRVDVAASRDALGYFARFDEASGAIMTEAAEMLSGDDLEALERALPALERLRDVLVELRRDDQAAEMLVEQERRAG